MTYTQLKYFCAVCKYNNISRAAENLFVSQPSVSQAIKELEEELGETLFLRNNNRLYMTESGRLLWEMSEEMLTQMELITTTITKKHLQEETLSIGILPELSAWVLPYIDKILCTLKKKYTNLDIKIIQVMATERDHMVLNHMVDVVFCNGDAPIPARFGSKLVAKSELKVLVGKQHRLAGEKKIRLPMLEKETLIGDYISQEQWGDWLQELFKDEGFIPETKYFFLQNEAVQWLLENYDCVAFGRPTLNGLRCDNIEAISLDPPRYIDVVAVYDNRYTIRNVTADLLKLLRKVPDPEN